MLTPPAATNPNTHRTWLITGFTGMLGTAMPEGLGFAPGDTVYVVSRTELGRPGMLDPYLQSFAKSHGVEVIPIQADLTQPQHAAAAIKTIVGDRKIDRCILAAGMMRETIPEPALRQGLRGIAQWYQNSSVMRKANVEAYEAIIDRLDANLFVEDGKRRDIIIIGSMLGPMGGLLETVLSAPVHSQLRDASSQYNKLEAIRGLNPQFLPYILSKSELAAQAHARGNAFHGDTRVLLCNPGYFGLVTQDKQSGVPGLSLSEKMGYLQSADNRMTPPEKSDLNPEEVIAAIRTHLDNPAAEQFTDLRLPNPAVDVVRVDTAGHLCLSKLGVERLGALRGQRRP